MFILWLFSDTGATLLYAVIASIFWMTTILLATVAWRFQKGLWVWLSWVFMLLTLITIAFSQIRSSNPAFSESTLYLLARISFFLLSGLSLGLCVYLVGILMGRRIPRTIRGILRRSSIRGT